MPGMEDDWWCEASAHDAEDCKIGDADILLHINRCDDDEANTRLKIVSIFQYLSILLITDFQFNTYHGEGRDEMTCAFTEMVRADSCRKKNDSWNQVGDNSV